MNKNKFYTIGLVAASLFASSCDDRVDCGCDCSVPTFEKWELLDKDGEKNSDGTVSSGSYIVVYGKNLSDVTGISFNGMNAELQPAYMEDTKLIFQVPEGISNKCSAKVYTAGCTSGYKVDLLKVVVSAPCVAMCDNEMAVKTLNVVGNSLFAPLTAKFWDGKGHTIEASTEKGTIKIDDSNHATIQIPNGVADNGTILFITEAGEYESEFIFRDTRNMLITHDDENYLNLFNQEVPDASREDTTYLYFDKSKVEPGKDTSYVDVKDGIEKQNLDSIIQTETIGLPIAKEVLKNTVFASENTNGDFSIFFDLSGYTAWTYAPTGTANTKGVEPEYPTPFGIFSEELLKGKNYNDYVIKFEVFVSSDYPIQGNGLAIGFYNTAWQDIRNYCAFWQPSKATFAKDKDGVWENKCTCEEWNSQGDWLTIAIPFEEIKYNFTAANYTHCAQDSRIGVDDDKYKGFGDPKEGLAFFDQQRIQAMKDKLGKGSKKAKAIQCIGIEFGNADQPNKDNEPLIAVDNLRITPKDNNGGVWPLLKWGVSSRDFYINYPTSCK